MAKQLERPREIRVKVNIDGAPIGLIRDGHSEGITAIYEHWRLADEWWGKEVERDYFQIKTTTGAIYQVFHDLKTRRWYLSRIYD
jgi:hypothetical protein